MSGSPNEPLLVIFDMDGTLVDSQHMIVAALETAFGSEGIAPPDRRTMLSIVGLSLIEAMQTLVSDADGAVHVRFADDGIDVSAQAPLRRRYWHVRD